MPNWATAEVFNLAPGDVSGFWVPVLDELPQGNRLHIKAEGTWRILGRQLPECGPDGLLLGLPLSGNELPMPDCATGALIGKLGGSAAALLRPSGQGQTQAAGDGTHFAIGTHCVVPVPKNTIGPLFIGFNCLARPVEIVTAFKLSVVGVTITIEA